MIDTHVRDDGLWTARINRPDKANSLTREMLHGFADFAEQASAQNAKAFMISGTGKVFSAGADLDEAKAGLAVDPVWERLSGAIAAMPCLSIAALNGTLAGGAMGMALACDIRIAAAHAKFFYPVMKLGFLPQPSDPARMRTLIGPARTKLVLMGGQKITADDALQYGLIDRIVEPEALQDTVDDIIAHSVAADPDLRSQIKTMCE